MYKQVDVDVMLERMEIYRLSAEARRVLGELQERTGFNFSDTLNGLATIDEVTPHIRKTTPKPKTETVEVPF